MKCRHARVLLARENSTRLQITISLLYFFINRREEKRRKEREEREAEELKIEERRGVKEWKLVWEKYYKL